MTADQLQVIRLTLEQVRGSYPTFAGLVERLVEERERLLVRVEQARQVVGWATKLHPQSQVLRLEAELIDQTLAQVTD